MLEDIIAQRMRQLKVKQNPVSQRELHFLCLEQEKHVINQVCQSDKFDIYHSIATVCPSQSDIKHISNDEVAARIHCLNNVNSVHQISYCKYNNSPESEEIEHISDPEPRLQGFCAFSQPSIRNFLDDVQESGTLWNNRDDFHE